MNVASIWVACWAVGQVASGEPSAPAASYRWNAEPASASSSTRAPRGEGANSYNTSPYASPRAADVPASPRAGSPYAAQEYGAPATARANSPYAAPPSSGIPPATASNSPYPAAPASSGSAPAAAGGSPYAAPAYAAPQSYPSAPPSSYPPAGGPYAAPDEAVTPAAAFAPSTAPKAAAPRETAATLSARYFHPVAVDDASFAPLGLEEAVAKSGSAGRHAQVVQTYWRLSLSTAQVVQRQREMERLEAIADLAGRQQPDARSASALFAAIKASQAALKEDETACGQLQRELADLVRWSESQSPIPVDLPHVGSYQTHFEQIYPRGDAPAKAVALHRTLPIRRQAVDARAAALRAADALAEALAEDYAAGKGTLPAVLAAERELSTQERAFLRTICEYNLDIADYALPLAPAGAKPSVVVGMLIKSSGGSKGDVTRAAPKTKRLSASGGYTVARPSLQ